MLNDDQAWRIREHLTDAQDELRQWHRDFAVLLATRPRIVDRVYRCKIALAPYKKLPAEITREIMLFVVGVPPSFSLPNYKAAAMDPRLQLTQVCADWRRIAFDITELWKIAFSRIPAGSSPSKLINAWWSHCSGSRLSLVMNKSYLRNSKGLFFGISSDAFLFQHLISPYSTRLVDLQVVMQVETTKKILALPAGSFKALENLVLGLEYYTHPFTRSEDLSTAFSLSPSLTKATFRTILTADICLLRLPWHQLTRLKLTTQITADLLLLLLSYCPSLINCSINAIKDIDADVVTRISSIPTLRLTNLRKLLQFVGSLNHHQFLRTLSLPNLHGFTLAHPSRDWVPSNYATFLKNTPTLTRFQMIKYPSTATGTLDSHFDELLMSYMPRLKTFGAPERLMISPLVLEKIARGELLPSVTKMVFGVSSLSPALEMLKARLSRSRENNSDDQNVISVIKDAVVSCGPNFGMEDMVQDLEGQGINILIKVLP